jgi:hypothetical protein
MAIMLIIDGLGCAGGAFGRSRGLPHPGADKRVEHAAQSGRHVHKHDCGHDVLPTNPSDREAPGHHLPITL